MAVLLVFGREIVNLILGSLYAPHWNLLVIGWIGYGIYFIARIFGIKHRTLGFNQIEFTGNLFGVAAAALAGFVMIPALSATGAAWVYVVIAVAIMGSQTYLAKKAGATMKDVLSIYIPTLNEEIQSSSVFGKRLASWVQRYML